MAMEAAADRAEGQDSAQGSASWACRWCGGAAKGHGSAGLHTGWAGPARLRQGGNAGRSCMGLKAGGDPARLRAGARVGNGRRRGRRGVQGARPRLRWWTANCRGSFLGRRERKKVPPLDELIGKSTGKRKTKGKQSNGDGFEKRRTLQCGERRDLTCSGAG